MLRVHQGNVCTGSLTCKHGKYEDKAKQIGGCKHWVNVSLSVREKMN